MEQLRFIILKRLYLPLSRHPYRRPNNAICCSSAYMQRYLSDTNNNDLQQSPSMDKRMFRVVRPKISSIPLAKPGDKIDKIDAMREYCLTEADLAEVHSELRRSAYSVLSGYPDTVYLVSDVHERALEVHGGQKGLDKARLKQNVTYKERLIMRLRGDRRPDRIQQQANAATMEMTGSGSGRVVHFAIVMNTVDMASKFGAAYMTGSKSLFAEAIHSLLDTVNQIVLATGIKYSMMQPDGRHPYGYGNLRYVSSLMAGCGIMSVGCGLSIYHGINGLLHPTELEPLIYAYYSLSFSFVLQGLSMFRAYREIKLKSLADPKIQFSTTRAAVYDYVKTGRDPSLNVVLLEDTASLFGVCIALGAVTLSGYLQSPIPDSIGSIAIGCLLAGVATFIIRQNTAHLVGQSIPQRKIDEIVAHLQKDPAVGSVHDVKATVMGIDKQRFKAELDFNGRNISSNYLDTCNLDEMLAEVKSFQSKDELQNFLLCYGDKIIDRLGLEVDRIEQDLKKNYPQLRHVDLEAL